MSSYDLSRMCHVNLTGSVCAVTGGLGFLGKRLTYWLLRCGADRVHVTDVRPRPGSEEDLSIPQGSSSSGSSCLSHCLVRCTRAL